MKSKGFTLIEVMMVVAIIGIIAAVALPAYSEHLIKGKVVDGTSVLADVRLKMEQSYQDNRGYDCSKITMPVSKYFTITCDATSGQKFTITATGKSTENMDGYQFTIDQDNKRQTIEFKNATTPLPAACWLFKKNGSC